MEEDLQLSIDDAAAGLRRYGYRVLARPVPGQERAYCESLRAGLRKADETLDWLHREYRCRGLSRRALALLHERLPEPCWGVEAPEREGE